MRVLIVKTSSMGDIIHTLPALTDAGHAIPGIQFDWVVEEHFADIPRMHPLVKRVIPVALRRFRKAIFSKQTRREWRECRQAIKAERYDLVIDAQGLLKSAFLARLANGPIVGFDKQSAREPLAAWFYQKRYAVNKQQHAILRVRELVSQALGYPLSVSPPHYGLDREQFCLANNPENYLVFLHSTTWDSKHWPEEYWIALANKAKAHGLTVKLPWGSDSERARAERISQASGAMVLSRLDLLSMAKVLAGANGVVTVDTGLGHLAAALNVPTIALFGSTNPVLSGIVGPLQKSLAATFPCAPCMKRECRLLTDKTMVAAVKPPCFATLPPDQVWQALTELRLCTL